LVGYLIDFLVVLFLLFDFPVFDAQFELLPLFGGDAGEVGETGDGFPDYVEVGDFGLHFLSGVPFHLVDHFIEKVFGGAVEGVEWDFFIYDFLLK
jgi:hypothetical protein